MENSRIFVYKLEMLIALSSLFFYKHSISIVEKDFTLILGVIVSDTLARPFFKYLGHINDLHTWQFPTGRQTGPDKIKIG